VDHAQVSDCEAASGVSVAIIDENGDYAAVVVTGANARLEAAQISVPQGVKVLLLQNEVPEAVNLTLVRKAGEGTCVIVNAAPVRAMAEDLMAATHILVVNRIEAAQLTGMDAAGLDGEKAAKALCAQGPEATIVTMGSDGLALCDGRMTERIPAVAVDAISSHGAGDMFCGALAAEVARGASLRAACRFAAAAAALAVSRPVDAGRELTEAQVRRMVDQSVSIP
jgi:ribokinase